MNPETKIYVKLGGRKYTLPVNPEEIEVKHTTVDQKENVVGVGEILIPQKPGLREISWSGFFPGSPLDPYVDHYRSVRTLAKAFEKAWKNRSKCRLIISRSSDYDTNMPCVISEWSCTDKGGEPDDLYYSVTFQEIRSYGVQQLTVVSTTGPGVALSGGKGKIRGTVVGIIFLGVILNGMTLLGVNDYAQYIVRGGLIVLAVILNALKDSLGRK